MRFVDANVFLYAILKPKRQLTKEENERKIHAGKIYDRINRGEEVLISTTHLSEIANILEDFVNLPFSIDFIETLVRKKNVKIEKVAREDYVSACVHARRNQVSVNDAVAHLIMVNNNIKEIYSFDSHFDKLGAIRIER